MLSRWSPEHGLVREYCNNDFNQIVHAPGQFEYCFDVLVRISLSALTKVAR